MPKIERFERATPELAAAWQALMPQLNPAAQAPDLAALDAMLSSGTTELFGIRLEPGEAPVGLLALVVFTTPTATHAWIEDVVVDEAHRGRGLGEALVRAAIDRARIRGAKAVDLTSRPARVAANRLYLRMGFQPRQTNLFRFYL